MFCGPLTPPKQGSVVITGTGIDAVATYTCDNGFNIFGKSTRVCLSLGVWSGQEPSCQGTYQCVAITLPYSGNTCSNFVYINLFHMKHQCYRSINLLML